MNGIPDPEGVSGTFAALERTAPIVQVADGVPTTTSMRIANGTNNEHRAVLQLVRDNLADFEEFGGVAFEMQPFDTAGGPQQRTVAILNEEHATLLLTYMRNNAIVKDFKKRLVREFSALRRGTAPAPLQGNELLAAAVIESQKIIEARDARIYQLESARAVDAPKVTYVDTYVTDADLLSFSTVASTNGVTEKWLRELLIAKDWIYCQQDSRWSEKKQQKVTRNRYSEKADKKRYFRRVEVHEAPRFRGSEVMHTLKITPAGAEAIARLIAKAVAA
ncbi:Rha family transcriptional regulator [Mycolicibacterium sp. XJ775]